jgi:hypothetical protein
MVLSQTSSLGKLSGMTRRVTLIHDPTYSTSTGSWLVNGLDADKQQVQIDLTALPPGITKDMIKEGQRWFVERSTTYNRLFKYVGEFTPFSHLTISASPQNIYDTGPYTNQYVPLLFGTPIVTQAGTLGVTTVSGNVFTVPLPGLYSISLCASTDDDSDQLNTRLACNGITIYSSVPVSPVTQTFCLNSGNTSFSVQAAWVAGSGTYIVNPTSYVVVSYVGSILS